MHTVRINYSTTNGHEAMPSETISFEGSASEAITIAKEHAIVMASRNWDVYTFTLISESYTAHYSAQGSLIW